MRIALLLSLTFLLKLTEPVLHVSSVLPREWLAESVDQVSIKDLILLGGGLFLIAKSVREIHESMEGGGAGQQAARPAGFLYVLVQVALMDIIFSLDSVITAVGMVEGDRMGIAVMVVAILIAIGVMLVFAESISRFVEHHPSLKMLALSFLILIGVMLVAEGIGTHIDKGYIYFAMAFSVVVEFLNLQVKRRARKKPAVHPIAAQT
jgi:predicted tellurium resistance membrane protein TerC